MVTNRELKKRIIDISYKHNLSHLGSCLTAVDIIKKIYDKKAKDEKFILSQGHAGLALYVILEEKFGINPETMLSEQGIHPDRLKDEIMIDCSTGSLGQGLPIAVGMALADRNKIVWCLISDGECAEGSIWEAFNIIDREKIDNIRIYLNMNGWSGYNTVSQDKLLRKIKAFNIKVDVWNTNVDELPFLFGLDGHYKVMNKDEYQIALEVLK